MQYDFKKIEKKWQKLWEEEKVFHVEKSEKEKFYVLDMFPYPSAEGLHMGHAFVYTLGDIFARFKRLQGFNVLYPIGYDAFGLPAENAAIKVGMHPSDYTKRSIANFMKQQKAMGWSYDWDRLLNTSMPEYYKWDQWIFLKMLERGIAFRKKAPVNWCEKCQTVLANEQVIDGKCWRHSDEKVKIKHLEQWFLKITDYAEELLKGLEKLDWSETAKKRQRNWIGKSEGVEVLFEINGEKWPIFTTRIDTLFGVTFLVISAQHERLKELVKNEQKKEVEEFLEKIRSTSEKDLEVLEKEGAFTGSYAIHPITGEKIPVWTGNFVLPDYGSGMVMAVPAHDERDFEFAKKYNIEIKQVIKPEGDFDFENGAYTGRGILVNSGEFNNLDSEKAKEEITKFLESKGLAKKTVNYKLRDWLISRQRYWGTPIPVVYCEKCGVVPVDEKDLPVELPEKVEFGKGNPLATNEDFVNVKCPKCGEKARRETDTMDTFANSSWYYLRYADPKNDKEIFDKGKVDYWCPIDQYIGGAEHITAHLIYIRFYTKFLRDIGMVKFDEPALRYFSQGMILGKDGEKMSKSKGNIVEPLETIEKYGADTLRLALVSFASADKDTAWNEKIVIGSHKFLNKVYDFFSSFEEKNLDERVESKFNKTVKEIPELIENFKHNLVAIKLRELFELIEKKGCDRETALGFLKMLSIYCPFVSEELYEKISGKRFIAWEKFPEYDEKKINEKFDKEEKILEKVVSDILNILKIMKDKGKEGEKVYLYALPNEMKIYDSEEISRRVGREVVVFAVNDKEKYDPEGKAKKAKPEKPAIFVE